MADQAPFGNMFDLQAMLANWQALWQVNNRVHDLLWTRQLGEAAVGQRQHQRLAELIDYARSNSPLYRDLYRQLPEQVDEIEGLPVTGKAQLMAEFDRWVTDTRITRSGVESFVQDPQQIGKLFLDEYAVWRSSGSSGVPGIFLHDRKAIEVYDALVGVQMRSFDQIARYSMGLVSGAGRSALVVAIDGHFASVATARRLQQSNPLLSLRTFSVALPLDSLVAQLNEYQPAFLSSYPTALSLLAQAQQAGQLKIRPVSIWSGGEFLSDAARALMESAFECPLINEYGTSECLSIAFGCRHGWIHVNSDWVILEAVDRSYRPVRPGEVSHTVLLTNLANRAAPIIRYDLGDSVILKPGRCECGSHLPAIQVEGRRDDVLGLRRADGTTAMLLPLAIASAVESASDVHRFQILQTGPEKLALRIEARNGKSRKAAWLAARAALRDFLGVHGLDQVAISLDPQAPTPDAASGKLHAVVALNPRVPRARD